MRPWRISSDRNSRRGDESGRAKAVNPPRLIPLVLMLAVVIALIYYLY
ncbi:hypothetical protein [Sphingosinicella sp. CPCC 101087]|nr:hypothetical protein [Sphingosinicella sp. CPCC 101087]